MTALAMLAIPATPAIPAMTAVVKLFLFITTLLIWNHRAFLLFRRSCSGQVKRAPRHCNRVGNSESMLRQRKWAVQSQRKTKEILRVCWSCSFPNSLRRANSTSRHRRLTQVSLLSAGRLIGCCPDPLRASSLVMPQSRFTLQVSASHCRSLRLNFAPAHLTAPVHLRWHTSRATCSRVAGRQIVVRLVGLMCDQEIPAFDALLLDDVGAFFLRRSRISGLVGPRRNPPALPHQQMLKSPMRNILFQCSSGAVL